MVASPVWSGSEHGSWVTQIDQGDQRLEYDFAGGRRRLLELDAE